MTTPVDLICLVFLNEFSALEKATWLMYFHLLCGHPDTVVGDRQALFVFIYGDLDFPSDIACMFSSTGYHFELLNGINSVGYEFRKNISWSE